MKKSNRTKPASLMCIALLALELASCGGSGGSPVTRGDARVNDASETDAGPVSQQCRDYCACFETDCHGIQSVPDGASCTAFCATFTQEQWQCRIDHCHLVVPEHNPNHCMHAVGIDQCL